MCLKKNTRLSQSHTRIPSSTSSSLLQACIQLCSWQGGRPQLVRVGDWWMLGGHLCGSGSWLDGQPQLCTSGPWLLLSSSQKGSSEFVKSDFNFIIYVDKALWLCKRATHWCKSLLRLDTWIMHMLSPAEIYPCTCPFTSGAWLDRRCCVDVHRTVVLCCVVWYLNKKDKLLLVNQIWAIWFSC